jgi:hypothetical protein
MRKRSGKLALVASAFFVGAVVLAPSAAAQSSQSDEVAPQELREFVAIFIELRENAAGFPGSEPPERERRESIEIIEEHGWTLGDYNRVASLVNNDRALFREFSRILEEDT